MSSSSSSFNQTPNSLRNVGVNQITYDPVDLLYMELADSYMNYISNTSAMFANFERGLRRIGLAQRLQSATTVAPPPPVVPAYTNYYLRPLNELFFNRQGQGLDVSGNHSHRAQHPEGLREGPQPEGHQHQPEGHQHQPQPNQTLYTLQDILSYLGWGQMPNPTLPTEIQIRTATRTCLYSELQERPYNICPITQETFTDSQLVTQIKHCKHTFMPDSIQHWFERNATCPVCRYDIRNTNNNRNNNSNNSNNNSNNRNNNQPHSDPNTTTSFLNFEVNNIDDESITFSYDLPEMMDMNGVSSNPLSVLAQAISMFSNNQPNSQSHTQSQTQTQSQSQTQSSQSQYRQSHYVNNPANTPPNTRPNSSNNTDGITRTALSSLLSMPTVSYFVDGVSPNNQEEEYENENMDEVD